MKRNILVVTALIAALSLATSAWAGGSMCSGKSEGAAKEASSDAKHCAPGMKASMASGKQCNIGANNAVFSFAVPTVHCESCVDKIQETAMAQKGVLCAKVDLGSKMAYVAGDKKLNQKSIAKAIQEAGYACTFKSKGSRPRAELQRLMAADNETPAPKKS